MKTLKVAALIQDRVTPSSRVRICQNIPYLADLGVNVESHAPFISPSSRLPGRLGKLRERYLLPVALAKALLIAVGRVPGTIASHKSDLAWIDRTYVLGIEGLVWMVKRPRVLDVSDAIWMTTPLGRTAAARFAKQMDAVIVGNQFVADWYSHYCKNVYVVPDGVDTERVQPSVKRAYSWADNFIIGWMGTSVNFHELYRIEPILARFLKDHAEAKLCVISNALPNFKLIPPTKLEYKCWSAITEATDLNGFDVGIMPLQETEWARGKNGNKMLCYMASGLPVVVSPVGINKEILQMGDIGLAAETIDDWYDCLETLFNNQNVRVAMGNVGRQIIERNFSIRVVSKRLASIFHILAG